ncbi:hypothetical protein TNCT_669731 [Trichonephila clavata]|uniref:Uncharacterized protein n=1 Tax=Trichonephila clavata TaxID=2740835 RepID=A0A8X6K5Y1_TRICU|nr:hypothetical protein TNCT_669731 [Trichonephila clavata]
MKKKEADEDMKILARIRSKERMQPTGKLRKEEQVKQSESVCNGKHECSQSEIWIHSPEWNFFTASHGKDAVDGIVKRSTWITIKSRKTVVSSVLEFYDLARSLSKNIFFTFVAKKEVKEKMVMLDYKWKRLKNIPAIQSKHFFQSKGDHSISVARTSLSHFKCTLVLKSLIHDSDNESIKEESPPTSHQASKSPAEACRKTDGTVCATVLPKDTFAGLYVLVQLLCKSGKKKITQYRYGCVCQSDMDEDGEIRVQFLTTIDGKRFTDIVNDILDLQFEDIITKLEEPEKKTEENNMFIDFRGILTYLKRNN